MNENEQASFTSNLDRLWRDQTAQIAASFAKRAVKAEMSLDELRKVLTFPDLRPHLHTIKLSDVLPQGKRETLGVAPAQNDDAPVGKRRKKRRSRRSGEDIQALKMAILERVQGSVGGTNSTHLTVVLEKSGMSVDALLINRLLKALAAEGYLSCTTGKPKIWRARPQGRIAPAPLIIRKGGQPAS
ncbi:MAG: hypothetical protein EOO38_00700 [Cytophagaceae bacterium]|nr:MAG: hypothetical protein EOO38_00700 [Cytophagaceae bacterium]